jgi:hypothetical protein
MILPEPVRFGGSTRWQLSGLELAEAQAKGEPAPPQRNPEDELYFSVKQVASRYSISTPTVWRWCK